MMIVDEWPLRLSRYITCSQVIHLDDSPSMSNVGSDEINDIWKRRQLGKIISRMLYKYNSSMC